MMKWLNILAISLVIAQSSVNGLGVPPPTVDKNYDIEIDDANVTVYIPDYINENDIYVEFDSDLNKPVVNGFINVIKIIPDDATGSLTGLQSDDGTTWHETLTQKDIKACEFLEKNEGIVKDICKKGSLWEKCPLITKKITFDKYFVDTTYFPSTMKKSKWRIIITFKTPDGKKIVDIFLQIKVIDK